MKANKHCFVSVGEHSGEILATNLVIELKLLYPRLRVSGITGKAMQFAGVESVASVHDLNVMGVVEVAEKIGVICALEKKILNFIDRESVDFAILVDFAGFHFRLAEALKLRGIKVIQYVAPKLWAWGAHRAERLRRHVDLLLAVLPFEEKYFRERGIHCKYVGSPHMDRTDKVFISRTAMGFSEQGVIIGLLPGSRAEEVKAIMPIFVSLIAKLKSDLPDAQFILPLASTIDKEILPDGLDTIPHLSVVKGMSLEVMSISSLCIMASGTATLECGLVGTPLVVVHKMNEFTYAYARKNVQIPWASLVNIMMKEEVVKEFIQHFNLDDITAEVKSLVFDHVKIARIKEKLAELKSQLRGLASYNAALEIHRFLENKSSDSVPL